MAQRNRPSTSYSTRATTSYPSYSYGEYNTTTGSRPRTRRSTGRPSTARPRTGASTIARVEAQQVVCAIGQSCGVAPTVGLTIVNLDTGEAVLCEICDSQTYVRTVHKLIVYGPSEILVVSSEASPKSKLYSIIEENLEQIGSTITLLDRRYWSETRGLEYIQALAFKEDVEALKLSVTKKYYAVCCTAAVFKYIDLALSTSFPLHSLKMKYEPSEGSMMIDVSTIKSLELVQNLLKPKSRDCLYGLLNETQTPMGGRLLRNNILQPLTDSVVLNTRYDALTELTTREEMFFATRAALKNFTDVDKVLTALITIPVNPNIQTTEQSINNVIMLKHFVTSVNPIYEALTGAGSAMLTNIRDFCSPENINPVQELIDGVINEHTTYAKQPLELRNQRTYAVKSGVNGLLDVARTTYVEATEDAYQHCTQLSEEYGIKIDLKYENARKFYIQIKAEELDGRPLPPVFTNVFRKKKMIECQTLELMKRNQKITLSHQEVVLMSDEAVQNLIEEIHDHMSILFKICEAVALLDMMSSFAHLVTLHDYVRPMLNDTLSVKDGRHPIREKIMQTKFVPNDIYATQQSRFQIITGCNMSGKSTYIRSVALMTIMAQIGCFVPASFASFPIFHSLFARLGLDDNLETNMSTFAAEMREVALILRNIDRRSMAIVDELGRGTSTRDGLAIALAIAEALVSSRALVWFVTHFKDLGTILSERNGVVNLHLAVQMANDNNMTMLYKVAGGVVKDTHYGLKLARIVPLPIGLVDRATFVAQKLEERLHKKKRVSAIVIRERRRKLILSLKEHLVQAHSGIMEGPVLTAWLKELQKEFINRMTAIDAEAACADEESEDEADDDQDEEDEDEEMHDRSDLEEGEDEAEDDENEEDGDEEMHDRGDLEENDERPSTRATNPTVISVSSESSTESQTISRAISVSASSVRAVSENEY